MEFGISAFQDKIGVNRYVSESRTKLPMVTTFSDEAIRSQGSLKVTIVQNFGQP